QVDILLEVSPDAVDAGAEMNVYARLSCSPSCDMAGHHPLVKEGAGADAGALELTENDDQTRAAGALAFKAPLTAVDHIWSALCPAFAKNGFSYEEASRAISFVVKPHTIRVLAWDAPPAAVAGETFKVKIGIKCSSECVFANKAFEIFDHG